ncbi:MAG: hypothetical protein Q9184_001891 [Pyrenodesmia sp. 2 TL-2023]
MGAVDTNKTQASKSQDEKILDHLCAQHKYFLGVQPSQSAVIRERYKSLQQNVSPGEEEHKPRSGSAPVWSGDRSQFWYVDEDAAPPRRQARREKSHPQGSAPGRSSDRAIVEKLAAPIKADTVSVEEVSSTRGMARNERQTGTPARVEVSVRDP